jgi:hypothetical protein
VSPEHTPPEQDNEFPELLLKVTLDCGVEMAIVDGILLLS